MSFTWSSSNSRSAVFYSPNALPRIFATTRQAHSCTRDCETPTRDSLSVIITGVATPDLHQCHFMSTKLRHTTKKCVVQKSIGNIITDYDTVAGFRRDAPPLHKPRIPTHHKTVSRSRNNHDLPDPGCALMKVRSQGQKTETSKQK